MSFALQLPSLHREAVQLLAYGYVTQLHLEVLRPFWEAAGGDRLLPYLWSDGPLERMFPRDELGQGRAETLTVWINGAGCARWDAMDDAQAARTAADELTRVYPVSRGAVRLARRVSWQQQPLAGGAWPTGRRARSAATRATWPPRWRVCTSQVNTRAAGCVAWKPPWNRENALRRRSSSACEKAGCAWR